jgi:hypothetical protein
VERGGRWRVAVETKQLRKTREKTPQRSKID